MLYCSAQLSRANCTPQDLAYLTLLARPWCTLADEDGEDLSPRQTLSYLTVLRCTLVDEEGDDLPCPCTGEPYAPLCTLADVEVDVLTLAYLDAPHSHLSHYLNRTYLDACLLRT